MKECVKRPTDTETEDDLLRMQEEWKASNQNIKPAVQIQRMRKRMKTSENPAENLEKSAKNLNSSPPKNFRDQAARFQIDLESENTTTGVIFPVEERNAQFISGNFSETPEYLAETMQKFQIYSKDDGFPETLDLSAYFKSKNGEPLENSCGKSFFAAEFDRIHGNLAENLDFHAENHHISTEASQNDDFQTENEKYLKSLNFDEIQRMKMEVTERFDAKLLEFLKNRGTNKEKSDKEPVIPKKISKFKASRQRQSATDQEKNVAQNSEDSKNFENAPTTKVVEEMMNELEVLEEYGNREDQEKYNRLATDAVHLDLTAKFGRNLLSRQQKNAVKLFDNCKLRPETSSSPSDSLVEQARSSIDQIKSLYLEEVSLDGSTTATQIQFGKGVNPILDNCWTLVPVRRVLDAVEKRHGHVTADDVEIVRLSLLWTLLLFTERKSAFFAFAQPNDFYVHLSEVYLIGAEILSDDVIVECAHRIMSEYVLPKAKEGKLSLRMTSNVAGLDAFMPFYENLLRNYEQYSMGNSQFAISILIGAYLNAPIGDSIEYRFSLWSPKRNIIRQMTVSSSTQRDILEAIKHQILERESVIFEQHYVQYCSLLGAYVSAIRDDVVTRDRNQLVFEIAAFEIGNFLERQRNDSGKIKEFQVLVGIIRKSIGAKLMIS